tara:strand:+ start:617 stop:766 length:150 start_codon:yes stop_codon:yes gene_type:complete
MATNDQQQKAVEVPYHKRIAMGAKLDGTSLQEKGGQKAPQSGLSAVKKK